MPGLSPDQEASRCDFYQAHYTVAQRCFSIDERMKQQAAETLGKVVDHNELHREFELLRAFMEAIGHVRDMFGKMDHALSLGGSVVDGLQHFYSQRSHVMHGTWMPYAIDSGFLKIPLVAKENESSNEWNSNSRWDDMDASNFIFTTDFVIVQPPAWHPLCLGGPGFRFDRRVP